ncbi:hypothetical protein FVE85_4518 [Porphyridium purpureum]|uniref:Uncharacterized protein n=1 Tax=Porphyridium purpureum TaxID=35688 RepID=A0A5J4YI44_PORPP|nr:hypothetical protein FVE85_4518 [Porphyridium purpureum]|eukprot:POR2638..scf297_16
MTSLLRWTGWRSCVFVGTRRGIPRAGFASRRLKWEQQKLAQKEWERFTKSPEFLEAQERFTPGPEFFMKDNLGLGVFKEVNTPEEFDLHFKGKGEENLRFKGLAEAEAAKGSKKAKGAAKPEEILKKIIEPTLVQEDEDYEEYERARQAFFKEWNLHCRIEQRKFDLEMNRLKRSQTAALKALPKWRIPETKRECEPEPINRWSPTETPPIPGYGQSKIRDDDT